jgi:signal transduction histidine kinase/ActR/RegA family two-component response regulator/HAMP domain-containing protein
VTSVRHGRRWRDIPFARKLAILLIALITVPVIAGVVYSTLTSRSALIATTRIRNLERARGTAEIIDAYFADARADVRTASGISAIVDLCEVPESEAAYERAVRTLRAVRDEQRLTALYVTDRAGRVLAATDERVALDSYQTGRAFLGAIAGDTIIDEPGWDAFDRSVTMKIAHAVRANTGDIVGTATAVVAVAAIDQLTSHDRNYGGFGEFPVLWTGAGLRLSDPAEPTRRFTVWETLPPEQSLVLRQRLGPAYPATQSEDPGLRSLSEWGAWLLYDPTADPHRRVVSERAGALHATIVPLQSQRWVYGIFVPEQRLFASLRGETLRDGAIAFFTLLGALALSVIATRWVSRPLHRVTDAANALARGDMSRRVGLDQADEFGQLAAGFDAMAAALANKEQELQAHAGELERRVEERTATLQLLERASRALASSLEPRKTGSGLAELLVPAAADFCAIHIRDQHGHVRRIACRHADAELNRVAQAMPETRPLRDQDQLITSEERATLRLSGLRVYELTAGLHFVGYLTAATSSPDRVFDADAKVLFEELGRRAGLALANALLHQETQDANRMKDEFLGIVSHELRTPLNAILGWTRLVSLSREAGLDPQKALEAVDRNARALARLVDDLLDVPRIVTGKLTLDVRSVDLIATLHGAIDAIRPTVQAQGLTLEFVSELPSAVLEADSQRLQQVFGNLLSNAVKFTPRGGRVTVRAWRSQEMYAVTIEDSGVGIHRDFLPYVFDRFRQADSSASRSHGGLGIGLSIVRHLVDMHGGQVMVSSDGPGQGSEFTVLLPVPYTELMETLDDNRPASDDAALAALGGLRLLALDDDADARVIVAGLLESAGAIVTTASSATEALALLRDSPGEFDAVLADIGMPDQDGYAFIASLRAASNARLREMPVIAVTAYATLSDRSRVLAAGFDAHVPKPVSLDAVASALLQSRTVTDGDQRRR